MRDRVASYGVREHRQNAVGRATFVQRAHRGDSPCLQLTAAFLNARALVDDVVRGAAKPINRVRRARQFTRKETRREEEAFGTRGRGPGRFSVNRS